MEPSEPQKNYLEFKKRFRAMSDEELIQTSQNEKSKPGWTNSRAYFSAALKDEFEVRKLSIPS